MVVARSSCWPKGYVEETTGNDANNGDHHGSVAPKREVAWKWRSLSERVAWHVCCQNVRK
jgi:hypothetical protein